MIRKTIILMLLSAFVATIVVDLTYSDRALSWQTIHDRNQRMTVLGVARGNLKFAHGALCPSCQDHIGLTIYSADFPVWVIALGLALYPIFAFVGGPVRRYGRRWLGVCVDCGYNLTGNVSGICSECGTGFDQTELRALRERSLLWRHRAASALKRKWMAAVGAAAAPATWALLLYLGLDHALFSAEHWLRSDATALATVMAIVLLTLYATSRISYTVLAGPARRWSRQELGLCVRCAHDLIDNGSNTCPGCATEITRP